MRVKWVQFERICDCFKFWKMIVSLYTNCIKTKKIYKSVTDKSKVILIFVKFLSKPLFFDLYSLIYYFIKFFLRFQLSLKGLPTRFLPPIFLQMDSSQASYSVFKDFPNLASNLLRYLKIFIDSLLLFIVESLYSLYSLLRRVATLRIVLAGSHYLLELSA